MKFGLATRGKRTSIHDVSRDMYTHTHTHTYIFAKVKFQNLLSLSMLYIYLDFIISCKFL